MEAALSSFVVPATDHETKPHPDQVFRVAKSEANIDTEFTLNIKDFKIICYMMGIKAKVAPSVAIKMLQELTALTIRANQPDEKFADRISFAKFSEVAYKTLSVNSRPPFDLHALTPFWDAECELRLQRMLSSPHDECSVTPLVPPHSFASTFSSELSPLSDNGSLSIHSYESAKKPISEEHRQSYETFCVLLTGILRIVCRQTALIILCGGTSGTGKTTLASLLAARLGIRTIVSTDSLREAMRHEVRRAAEEASQPISDLYAELFVSTYEASSCPNSQKVVEKKMEIALTNNNQAAIAASVGHKIQSAMVKPALITFITSLIQRKESAIIEGVHLTGELMEQIAAEINQQTRASSSNGQHCCPSNGQHCCPSKGQHCCPSNGQHCCPSAIVVPSLIHIEKEDSHQKRFAVRVKGMSQDPVHNKYIREFSNIRAIQEELVNGTIERQLHYLKTFKGRQGSLHFFPVLRVLNTNVDRSVMRLHLHSLRVLEMVEAASALRPTHLRKDVLVVMKLKLTKECMYDYFRKAFKNATAERQNLHTGSEVESTASDEARETESPLTTSPSKHDRSHRHFSLLLGGGNSGHFDEHTLLSQDTNPLLKSVVAPLRPFGLASLSAKDSLELIQMKNAGKGRSSSCPPLKRTPQKF